MSSLQGYVDRASHLCVNRPIYMLMACSTLLGRVLLVLQDGRAITVRSRIFWPRESLELTQ